jgi:hypothetical protein
MPHSIAAPPQWPADSTFADLRDAMPSANFAAAVRCADRLYAILPHRDRLADNTVMVAYGGGKDSSYMLAFVRAAQLVLLRLYGSTFRLRSVTNRHAGMPVAVLENIDRVYQALAVSDDPACELLLVDEDSVIPFAVDAPHSERVVERNRQDILMTGHRTNADGRPTFCNACNLSMVNSFGLAAAYDGGVDIVVTGDSPAEQRAYTLWVRRLARRLESAGSNREPGFRGFLSDLDVIAQSYFTDVHGPDATDAVRRRRVTSAAPKDLTFFSIYSDTEYAAGEHFSFLTDYLGFRFDDLAFSFTESDCGNPTLMAHLRGLKTERLYGRDYGDGIVEYLDFAIGLMRGKDFPENLIEVMRERYSGPERIAAMRAVANDFAEASYGLSEQQLVCMVFAPFAEKAAGLERFLAAEYPDLLARIDEIRAVLSDSGSDSDSGAAGELAERLERMSGLPLANLRVLYRSSLAGGWAASGELIEAVLAGDPHKGTVRTRHSPDGPVVLERISGR